MKNTFRTFVVILLIFCVICVSGCQSEKPENEGQAVRIEGNDKGSFRAGYGKASLLPDESVPMAGFGNSSTRMSTGYLDPLYAMCVAISDKDDNTVLLITCDQVNMVSEMVESARKLISSKTGIDKNNIMISATHTHSGVDIRNNNEASITRYNADWPEQLLMAANDALADRKKTELLIGSVEEKGLNFVRHVYLDNGECIGNNHGTVGTSKVVKYASEADCQMQLARFKRDGGKDIILANFQAHPTMTGGQEKLDLSADFIGAFRTEIEEKEDAYCMYFNGASGNLNPTSYIKEDTKTTDYKEYADMLIKNAESISKNMKKVSEGQVKVKSEVVPCEVNHSEDSLLAKAKEIQSAWTTYNDLSRCIKMGEPYGIFSPYHANAIAQRTALGETLDVEISTVSIGDLAFVLAPYEMFDTNGETIKKESPYEMTFILCYSNNHFFYVPSKAAFEYGCYEADTCRFVKGTGELLQDKYSKMLESMK